MVALQDGQKLNDAMFRLLVCLGEHPDPSGKTPFCETTVQRMVDQLGPWWDYNKVVKVADDLRDIGYPIGVVGGFLCWRPAK